MASVLGEAGVQALNKVAERSQEIGNVLLPRTILAWIRSEDEFDGELPGVVGSSMSFMKAEGGFTGSVDIAGQPYAFQDVSIFHLVAATAVALGEESASPLDLRDLDLERLGKNIDLLARTKMIAREMKKNAELSKKSDEWMGDNPGDEKLSDEEFARKYDCDRETVRARMKKDELEKAAKGPGQPAAAIAPSAPTAPTAHAPAPTAAAMKPPKVKPNAPLTPAKPPTVKLTRSEAAHACSLCGSTQFRPIAGPGSMIAFLGCHCLSELTKSAVSTEVADGYVVQLKGWDRESLLTLLEAVGRV